MLLVVGIGILTISVPYFVSRRVRAAIRQAATMANRPGSGILRAITTTELSLLFLGLAVVVVYWIPPVPSQNGTLGGTVLNVLALVALVSLITTCSQILFNFPRIFAPKELRGEFGVVIVLFRRLAGRKPPANKSRDAATKQWDAAWGGGATAARPQPRLAAGEVVVTQRSANRRQSESRWAGGEACGHCVADVLHLRTHRFCIQRARVGVRGRVDSFG